VVSQGVAPIVLLGYRRPEFTDKVFEAIRSQKPKKLFLVMDGPKADSPADADAVARTREVVRRVDWECEVHEIFAKENLGLKKRVSSGLDEVFRHVTEAIIVEDDCLPSPDFFQFATELLEKYASNPRVGIISGSSRLRGRIATPYSYDFSADVRIWGWATWSRTWQGFRESGDLDAGWDDESVARVLHSFPRGSRRRSMRKMLLQAAQLDSWALPFVVHCRNKGYVNPMPAKNLVTNIGFGESSTHTKFESFVAEVKHERLNFPLSHPHKVAINPLMDRMESRLDVREAVVYPLKHPLDTARRLFRFLRARIASL
jgi:hypothetical protein